MNLTKNLVTLICSLLFVLLISEILFRMLDIGYGNAPLEQSKEYHHAHPKNYSFLMHQPKGEYGGFRVFYDENGYRTSDLSISNFKHNDNDSSILFLGDSYTEGNQVLYENTFVNKVGENLKVNTINLGVSSYSPILYLLQTKKQIPHLRSKIVILQIFRNDFGNDKNYLTKAEYNENYEIVGINGGEKNIYIDFLRKSYLLRFLRKSQLLILELMKEEKISNNILRDIYIEDVNNNDLLRSSEIILDIKKELNKLDKELFVFMIPSKILSINNICCEKDKVYKKFKNEMENKNIQFLDISKYFSNYNFQENLFFKQDIHLTSDGHKILADGLTSEIKKFLNYDNN